MRQRRELIVAGAWDALVASHKKRMRVMRPSDEKPTFPGMSGSRYLYETTKLPVLSSRCSEDGEMEICHGIDSLPLVVAASDHRTRFRGLVRSRVSPTG
jgi:hypothetical protein